MKFIETIKQKITYYKELASYENTPLSAKILMFIAACYLISPIDLIPDFIPIIGFLDDLIIVPYLIWLAFQQIEAAKAKDLAKQKEKEAIGVSNSDHCETQQ